MGFVGNWLHMKAILLAASNLFLEQPELTISPRNHISYNFRYVTEIV